MGSPSPLRRSPLLVAVSFSGVTGCSIGGPLYVDYQGTVLRGSTTSWRFYSDRKVTSQSGDAIEGVRVTLRFTEATRCTDAIEANEPEPLSATTDATGRFHLQTEAAADPWSRFPGLFCVTHPEYKTLSVRVILQESTGSRVDFVLEPKTK